MRLLLLIVLLATAPFAPARAPVAATPHFAFFSDFDTNLNDALIEAGLARSKKRPELFHGGADAGCFAKLPETSRAAWDRVVDYYAAVVSPGEFKGETQFLLRMDLAGFDAELARPRAREMADIVAALRAAAAPAYRACRWTAQDAANRQWIAETVRLLETHEAGVARTIQQRYAMRWRVLPIPVDVVETVNWAGANTILIDGGGGHLLISVGNTGLAKLEIVFHEATHLFMAPDAPLRRALAAAAKKHDWAMPRDFWHPVQFVTTGEIVRAALAKAGERSYTPMIHEIFGRSPWGTYRLALEAAWIPYVRGETSLARSASHLVAEAARADAAAQQSK